MDIFSAVLLGLVQGLTEFLPISSSGHLVLSQQLLGFRGPNLAFALMLHLGTILAVLIYFRRDIADILSGLVSRSPEANGRRYFFLIVTASIPTAIIGFTLEERFTALFGQPHIVAGMLWITAAVLILSDRVTIAQKSGKSVNLIQALIVGTVQGIAIIPGISRSGSTIAAAIFSGVSPETAARFSFLLSIPAIIGAALLEIKQIANIGAENMLIYFVGMMAAFISGYLAIDILLKTVVKRKLWKFSIYLFIVGFIGFVLT